MAEVKEGKVTAQLYDLYITERKDDYSARIVTRESRSISDLARLAVGKRTDLNINTLISSYNLLKEVAVQQLVDGSNVEFGLGISGLVIGGAFIGESAQFDPAVHTLSVSTVLSADVREALTRVQIKMLGVAKTDPMISKVIDVTTGEVNTTLTPGGGLNLEGLRIRVVGEDPAVGIAFRSVNGDETVKVPMTSLLVNNPSAISLIIPATLEVGEYYLELTTQFSNSNGLLKSPRTAVYPLPLVAMRPTGK